MRKPKKEKNFDEIGSQPCPLPLAKRHWLTDAKHSYEKFFRFVEIGISIRRIDPADRPTNVICYGFKRKN
ncbi:MAG: hypothetical protein AMJ89_01730 [candidate division Zixibacteria bacterium SM23_73]|nr:MAG: hypothetical protein AMJ89_01730 [candidate division Zixibacteria bacterium SM23_73]